LFAAGAGSLTAGIITLIVFVVYTQVENHILNPIVMSRTVKVNPLLVLLSILVGASIGAWIGGIFGAFVAALLSIPAAGAIQVLVREVWLSTAPRSADPVAAVQRAAPDHPGPPEPADDGHAGPDHAGPDHAGPDHAGTGEQRARRR
jgi:hypothetical protein